MRPHSRPRQPPHACLLITGHSVCDAAGTRPNRPLQAAPCRQGSVTKRRYGLTGRPVEVILVRTPRRASRIGARTRR